MAQVQTKPSRTIRALATILVAAVVFAACGGDDAATDSSPSASDTTDEATGDTSADQPEPEPQDGGPIEGALVSVLSFDFGLWALDPAGGDSVALTVPDTGYSERLAPALTSPDGSRAYMVVYTQVDGQSFTHRVGLGEIDLATGSGRLVAELGQDRSDDEATDYTTWELLGVADDTVWLVRDDGMDTVLAVDPATDTVVEAVAPSDQIVRYPAVVGDVLYAHVNGQIVALGAAGWEPVIDLNDLAPDAAFDVASINDFAVTRSGQPLTADFADSILSFFEPAPTAAGMVAMGDLLYWQFNTNQGQADGETAILGGFVEFDPATATVLRSWPIGPSVGVFLEENRLETSSLGTWHVADGVVWFADARDNGDLLRLDPATGVTAFDIAPLEGADYTRIELIPNDPDGVWLLVEDWTITNEDESGRSASGETRFQLMDPTTGDPLVVVDESDLIGF